MIGTCDNRKPVITLMVGLPRSGKSTWVKNNRISEVVICADRLRYLIYNQRFWADGEPLVWAFHDIILRMLLEQRVDLIVDETNYTRESRAKIIRLAKQYNYSIHCVLVKSDPALCIKRAQDENYSRIIPFIETLAPKYEKPQPEEGFDKIILVN